MVEITEDQLGGLIAVSLPVRSLEGAPGGGTQKRGDQPGDQPGDESGANPGDSSELQMKFPRPAYLLVRILVEIGRTTCFDDGR